MPCMPETVRNILEQWTQALLMGSVNLEALTMGADAAPCPPVLGCLPKLRYLELTLWQSEAWLSGFFADLSTCPSLESLKLNEGPSDLLDGCRRLPNVNLGAMPKLRRVELDGWLPAATFSLPPACELSVEVVCNTRCPWGEHWTAMQRNLTVLSLWELGLEKWPAGVQHLSRLQSLRMQYLDILEQDLAVLGAIPHVDLYIAGIASLTVTAGSWQSLQVHGKDGLCITFTNANAFVRGTERFLFSSTGPVEIPQPMCAAIREACSRQSKPCYQCRFKDPPYGKRQVVRLSNCADAMRLEPSSDGKIVPSGGLLNGYTGTPEDSPLWERLDHKPLVPQDDVWPKWEPQKWVFGS